MAGSLGTGAAESAGLTVLEYLANPEAGIVLELAPLIEAGLGDLFSAIFGGGRPKVGPGSATNDIVNYFRSSKNPALQYVALISQALMNQGIPWSASSGPGRQALDHMAAVAGTILQLQGFDLATVKKVWDITAHQGTVRNLAGQPLATFDTPPATPAPTTWAQLPGLAKILKYPGEGKPTATITGQDRDAIRNWMVTALKLPAALVWWPTPVPTPQPAPSPGPETQPPQPPPPPPETNPTIQALQWFCQACVGPKLGAPLAQLASLVPQISQIMSGVDLGNMSAALQALSECVCPSLKDIAAAIREASPGEPQPLADLVDKLVEAIRHAGELQDIPQDVVNYVTDTGVISGEASQLAGGALKLRYDPIAHSEVLKHFVGKAELSKKYVEDRVDDFLGTTIPAWLDWVIKNILTQLTRKDASGLFTDPAWKKLGTDFLKIWQQTLGKFGEWALTNLTTGLADSKSMGPEDAESNFKILIGNASALGAGAFSAASIGGILLGSHSAHLNYLAALFALGSGYEEVSRGLIRHMTDATIAAPARYHYLSKYTPLFPDEFSTRIWYARGNLTDAEYKDLLTKHGQKKEYLDHILKNSYKAVSPFLIMYGLGDTSLDAAGLKDALTFSEHRPKDVKFIMDAMEQHMLSPYRQSALAVARTARERGLLPDSEWNSALDTLKIPQAARGYINLQIAYAKLVQLGELYRRSLDTAVKYDLIPLDQYIPSLEAIGIDEADAKAHYAMISNEKSGKALAAAEHFAAAEKRRVQMMQTRGLEASYMDGKIGDKEFTAALVAAGWDLQTAGLIFAATKLRKEGRLRLVYGLYLQPEAAQKLRLQVAALHEQATHKLLTPTQMSARLKALKIPDPDVQSLVDEWTAIAYKSLP